MSVKLRLARMGRKKKPFYRIVVTDSRSPRDGKYIECVGTYNPLLKSPDVQVKEDRVNYWLDQGVVPTDTVRSLLQRGGVILKRHLKKCQFDETRIEEELKKWEVLQIERQRRKEARTEARKKEKKIALEKKEDEEKEDGEVKAEAKTEAEVEESVSEAEEQTVSADVDVEEEKATGEDEVDLAKGGSDKEQVKEQTEAKSEQTGQPASEKEKDGKGQDSGEKGEDSTVAQSEEPKDEKVESKKRDKDKKNIEAPKKKKEEE